MSYVDGYVIPVPTKNVAAYRRMARLMAKVYLDHGALEIRECIGEDLKPPIGLPFPAMIKARRNETVIFSWIMFKSRAHRDRVQAKVMNDPRVAELTDFPIDCRRMLYGGFKSILHETASKEPRTK